MIRLTDVVRHLLIINVLVFLLANVVDLNIFTLYYPGSEKFQPYQLVTHFFMHGNLPHLLFNMFALVMFGPPLEALWGPRRFLFFYFACAFGAAILQLGYYYFDFSAMASQVQAFAENPSLGQFQTFVNNELGKWVNPAFRNQVDQLIISYEESPDPALFAPMQQVMEAVLNSRMNVGMVGASGAIFGLLLAFGMKFPNTELMLIFLPIPIKAKYFIPLLMIVELYLGVNNFSWDNIAHFAHLGGALFGFLIILLGRRLGHPF